METTLCHSKTAEIFLKILSSSTKSKKSICRKQIKLRKLKYLVTLLNNRSLNLEDYIDQINWSDLYHYTLKHLTFYIDQINWSDLYHYTLKHLAFYIDQINWSDLYHYTLKHLLFI